MQQTLSIDRPVRPWAFVPSLYFVQGLPYSVVMLLSVILYKRLGVNNVQIAFWTSILQLPWVLKPLWSPLVDVIGTRRRWVTVCQLLLALSLAVLAATLHLSGVFLASIGVFFVLAVLSATHDIAADGFYILALSGSQQAFFSGIRNSAYRVSMIVCQGGLVMAAGALEGVYPESIATAWSLLFVGVAALLLVGALWHRHALPRPSEDVQRSGVRSLSVLRRFFAKPGIGCILMFLLLYRLGEAQLLRMATPFMLDARADGGLGLSTAQVGFGYGVLGVGALLVGGILGGVLVARQGLARWLLPMWLALNVPNVLYVLLAWGQPEEIWLVWGCIGLEQFGYGFGFTGYMLAMIAIAAGGEWKTTHYALCTGLMALGIMVPGMWSGWLQQALGYPLFFGCCLLCAAAVYPALRRLPRVLTLS